MAAKSHQTDLPSSESNQTDLPSSESKQTDLPSSESKQKDPTSSESNQTDIFSSESHQADPTSSESHQANPPRSYLCLSIFTLLFTLLCCVWPLGLTALIFSLKVNSAKKQSYHDKARSSSRIAKWLNIAGIITGALLLVGVFVFLIVFATVIVPTSFRNFDITPVG